MAGLRILAVIFAILVLWSAVSSANIEVINWERDLGDKVVNEFVSIDNEKQQILMSSSDSCLKETRYLQSISLHDFKAQDSKQGLVALKAWSGRNSMCFVTEVAKGFDETRKETQERSFQQIPLPKPGKYYTFGKDDRIEPEELRKRSPALAEFCSGFDTVKLAVIDQAPRPDFFDRFFWVLCIIWPYPIFPTSPLFPWPSYR